MWQPTRPAGRPQDPRTTLHGRALPTLRRIQAGFGALGTLGRMAEWPPRGDDTSELGLIQEGCFVPSELSLYRTRLCPTAGHTLSCFQLPYDITVAPPVALSLILFNRVKVLYLTHQRQISAGQVFNTPPTQAGSLALSSLNVYTGRIDCDDG